MHRTCIYLREDPVGIRNAQTSVPPMRDLSMAWAAPKEDKRSGCALMRGEAMNVHMETSRWWIVLGQRNRFIRQERRRKAALRGMGGIEYQAQKQRVSAWRRQRTW